MDARDANGKREAKKMSQLRYCDNITDKAA